MELAPWRVAPGHREEAVSREALPDGASDGWEEGRVRTGRCALGKRFVSVGLVWLVFLVGVQSRAELGDWPEGPVFPLVGGESGALLEVSLEAHAAVWWCTVRNREFGVEVVQRVRAGASGGLVLGVPLTTKVLYTEHEEFVYPGVFVDGESAPVQLVVNWSLFSIRGSEFWYGDRLLHFGVHPWIEDALSMEEVAPEQYARGYEIFAVLDLTSLERGEEREVRLVYTHHETFTGGALPGGRMVFELQYALDWSERGGVDAWVTPAWGMAEVDAPALAVDWGSESIHIYGNCYREALGLRMSYSDLVPAEVYLRVGETVAFRIWGANPWEPYVWVNEDPAVGQVDEDGVYTALAEGEDRVWLEYDLWPSSGASRVWVIEGYRPTPTPRPTYPPTGTPEPTATPWGTETAVPTETPVVTETPEPTATGEATMTPTLVPTVAPTASPSPGSIVYDLLLNAGSFEPGDRFLLERVAANGHGFPVEVGEVLALEAYGMFWWWPSWTGEVELTVWTMGPGRKYREVFLEFIWPSGPGGGGEAMFIGGLLDPETWEVYAWDYEPFSW
jgi:hypothetical protein